MCGVARYSGSCGCKRCGHKTGALAGVFDNPAAGTTTAQTLILQLNRYTAAQGAPLGFQLLPAPAPIDGPLTAALAATALSIVFKRSSAAGDTEGAAKALAGMVKPLEFVNANIAWVTSMITIYGNLNGLAPARGESVLSTNVLIGIGLAVAAYFVLRGPKPGG